ncbi:uncharacterized protein LTR77_010524 [Saxophila tyrrhenica]|uniref:Uncharacterized protein n=1 Tax=Saxophila tyrrhenica TaxID=1690608 RepID=A0AAV9NUY7_9PEZI|nr:hypothetical protein LTR77_010524 [Saxophila tyrrhenica]
MTPAGLMRTLLPRHFFQRTSPAAVNVGVARTAAQRNRPRCDPRCCMRDCRCFAQVHDIDKLNRDVYFISTPPRYNLPSEPPKGPDERTLQLGKTVRTLHERLPTLLQSPLPSDILSPNISLHLFPSTHPHLPTVSGRLAYVAALWTAPVAWGRVPLVGNVKLTILSERMVKNGGSSSPVGSRDEKLIVKWKTCGKTKARDGTGGAYRDQKIGSRDPVDKIRDFISGTTIASSKDNLNLSDETDGEFTGLFIFEFDKDGKILKHVIEHTEEGGRWDSMTRVVSVTDWLLGNLSGRKREERLPELAWCEERPTGWRIRIVDRSHRQ